MADSAPRYSGSPRRGEDDLVMNSLEFSHQIELKAMENQIRVVSMECFASIDAKEAEIAKLRRQLVGKTKDTTDDMELQQVATEAQVGLCFSR